MSLEALVINVRCEYGTTQQTRYRYVQNKTVSMMS